MNFDPWITAPVGRGSASKKKIARLAGRDPQSGKAYVLVKLHDWGGRAIYLYNLVTGEMRHIPRPSEEVWNRYWHAGTEIIHPGKIQVTNVTAWVEYGKEEARKLGLKIEV